MSVHLNFYEMSVLSRREKYNTHAQTHTHARARTHTRGYIVPHHKVPSPLRQLARVRGNDIDL